MAKLNKQDNTYFSKISCLIKFIYNIYKEVHKYGFCTKCDNAMNNKWKTKCLEKILSDNVSWNACI